MVLFVPRIATRFDEWQSSTLQSRLNDSDHRDRSFCSTPPTHVEAVKHDDEHFDFDRGEMKRFQRTEDGLGRLIPYGWWAAFRSRPVFMWQMPDDFTHDSQSADSGVE